LKALVILKLESRLGALFRRQGSKEGFGGVRHDGRRLNPSIG